MAKINIGDLKKYAKNTIGDKKMKVDCNGLEVELLKHTTLLEKVDFASFVYNESINTDNGIHVIKHSLYKVALKIGFINKYTNITLPQDGLEAYSLITDSGLYEDLYGMLPKVEREELEDVIAGYIEEKHEQYKQENSTIFLIKSIVNTFKDFIPSITEVQSMIEKGDLNLDGEGLELITNILNNKDSENNG